MIFLLKSLRRLQSHFRRKRKLTKTLVADDQKRKSLMHKKGTALTDLSVYGYVEVAGRRYEARSRHYVFIRRGTHVRIVGRENFAYLVEETA
ncbi:MAG: NfeD family protein [Bacteroidota bacterium]